MTADGLANGQSHSTSPKITLYTNHLCPYAHRAHITLEELGLPFEEVIIDLGSPRPQWYLDINHRGLVPSMSYTIPGLTAGAEIITESQVVAQFLCDSFPSHLMPGSREDAIAPLRRARMLFFVDTWNAKVNAMQMSVLLAASEDEKGEKCAQWAAMIEKEIEPLLADANPFFGGSEKLTFADAMAAPFVLRMFALAKDGDVYPKSFAQALENLPNFGKWAKAVCDTESVLKVWDEKATVEGTKRRTREIRSKRK